jgi:hypothetical protein
VVAGSQKTKIEYVLKTSFFGPLTAKFSKEIDLSAGQMLSKLDGEMVRLSLEHYP